MRADCIQVRGLKALVLLLLVLYEGHTKEICRTGVKTDKNLRGVNLDKTSGLPFYWFDLHRASDGYHPEHIYTFRLHSSSKASPFSDAVLQVQTASNNCGTGELIVNTTFLYQPRNCPNMVMTEYKKPMSNVPFKWRAPKCGCVTFRATVIRNGATYFYDDEKVSDGNLVKTVCPHGVRLAEQLLVEDKITTDSTTKSITAVTSKMDRAARLELLCKITSTLNNVELLKRPEFIARRKLQNLSLVKLLNVELALEQRRADISSCCRKKGEDKAICFDNVRRYRIDQLCGDGQPRIPFVEQKNDYMRKRESECCWRIGEPRYQCFNKSNAQYSDYSVEYSQDESDPANDIADYPTEVHRYEKASNTKLFSPHPTQSSEQNDNEQNVEALTKMEVTANQAAVPVLVTLPPHRQTTQTPAHKHLQTTLSSSQVHGQIIPTPAHIRRRQRPIPAVAATKLRLRTGGQGDMGYHYRKRAKSAITPNLRHSASSVEITVKTLKQKLWKSSLKLECCQQGRLFATKSSLSEVWDRCRSAAKVYRSSVVRGKNICSNTFQKCCVEQFITAAAKTETIPKPATVTPKVSHKLLTTNQSVTEVRVTTESFDLEPLDFDNSREAISLITSQSNVEDANDSDDDDDDDDEDDIDDDLQNRKFLDYPKEDPSSDTLHKFQPNKKYNPNTNTALKDSDLKKGRSKSTKRKRNRRRNSRKLKRRRHRSD